jgi:cytochrome c peroxidase
MFRKISLAIIIFVGLFVAGCGEREASQIALQTNLSKNGLREARIDIDEQLRSLIDKLGIARLDPVPNPDPQLVGLGQALFFDKILSGNRDIACATCHHPTLASGDGIPLPIGTQGVGLGEERTLGLGRGLIPRNSPDVFNRGAMEWESMFWDSRVAVDDKGAFTTPAGNLLPIGLDSVLAAQAMFPVTSVDEMRGHDDGIGVTGIQNELALIGDDDLSAMWEALTSRLLAYPEYVGLFNAAYPNLSLEEIGFQHSANAIAAFEIDAFSLNNSPWDRYLEGDNDAMSEGMKEGALLFYDQGGCVACHSGPLLTDQLHHVLATPQIGPGKGVAAPWDMGRMGVTEDESDFVAFRTPSLLNVAQTGPWMHDGAYSTLEAVIRHHLDPAGSLDLYNPFDHLSPELSESFQNDEQMYSRMLENLDPILGRLKPLSDAEIAQLIAFLECLTDPAIDDLGNIVPETVPSGLPVID